MDTIVSGERVTVKEKLNVKHALMNGFPEMLINSIPTVQPSVESLISVSIDDNGEIEIGTINKKPTS